MYLQEIIDKIKNMKDGSFIWKNANWIISSEKSEDIINKLERLSDNKILIKKIYGMACIKCHSVDNWYDSFHQMNKNKNCDFFCDECNEYTQLYYRQEFKKL